MLMLAVTPLLVHAQEAAQLQITSKHYVLMNADTGDVFAQRAANDRVAIASVTKIFTAIEALELAPLDTPITTDESDLMSSDATTMGFGPGETYTLEDMLYGMLLPSGNDAAHAIARSLGGQPGDTPDQAVQRFMDLMNQRVQDMGLQNTHLVRPDGWGVPNHYSSAADVAAFFQYAISFPTFVKVISTSSYTTSNGLITVSQSNKMINTYPRIVGGKTGYDDDAGWCLVNLAQDGNTKMIAVTLDGVAPDDWYDDNSVLLDYGFEQQAALASSGTPFTGTVIGYKDPAAAQLAREAQPSSSLGAISSPVAASPTPIDPVTDQTRTQAAANQARSQDPSGATPSEEKGSSSSKAWIAIMVVLVLGVGGFVGFRLRTMHPPADGSSIKRRRPLPPLPDDED